MSKSRFIGLIRIDTIFTALSTQCTGAGSIGRFLRALKDGGSYAA